MNTISCPNYALLSRAYQRMHQDGCCSADPGPGLDQVQFGARAFGDTAGWDTLDLTPGLQVPHEGQAYLTRLREVMAAPTPTTSPTIAPAARTAAVAPVGNTVDPKDWHIPTLNEAFDLARKYPDKKVYLDTKTSDDPNVARRLGSQLSELFKQYPDLKDRVVIMNKEQSNLDAIKQEFAKDPNLKDFRNFTLDNEHLNDRNPSAAERSPLTGSGDNRYVSIGDPKNPLTSNNFGDLVEEVRKARQEIDRPGSPHEGKKVIAWTLNDQDKIRQVVQAGAHGVLTDDPAAMNRTLDQMGYGKAGQDPRRPEVIAHRGGPNSKSYPENTLPAMEAGFKSSDAIEIDIASAKDGIVVFHDNNPNNVTVSMARNLGLEASNDWRPVFPDIGSDARGKRIDELTVAEVRKNYGYEQNPTHSLAANLLGSGLNHALRAPGTALNFLGKYARIGDFNPLGWAGTALNYTADNLGKPIVDGLVKGLDQAVTGTWNGLKTAANGIGSGVSNIFKGNIGKGLGQIGSGLLKGAGQVITGIGKGIGSFFSGIGKGIGKFFKGLFG